MNRFGKNQGYIGKPCEACKRYKVERYSSGFEICEKCHWCSQLSRYISDNIFLNGEKE